MSNEKEEESWDQGHKNEFYLPHFKQQLYIHSLEKLKGSTNLFRVLLPYLNLLHPIDDYLM